MRHKPVIPNIYADEPEIYENVKQKLSVSIESSGFELEETNEIGKIKKIDRRGITSLRIRGMWEIQHPIKAFSRLKLEERIKKSKFSLIAIIKADKYNTFPEVDREKLENMCNNNFQICSEQILSPNNPAQLIDIKLITYFIS